MVWVMMMMCIDRPKGPVKSGVNALISVSHGGTRAPPHA